jgi:hypothetical protein
MALNIGSQLFDELRELPLYTLMMRKVMTTDAIQNMVDNTNMVVVIARSHFRDRVRNPLVLFHHDHEVP